MPLLAIDRLTGLGAPSPAVELLHPLKTSLADADTLAETARAGAGRARKFSAHLVTFGKAFGLANVFPVARALGLDRQRSSAAARLVIGLGARIAAFKVGGSAAAAGRKRRTCPRRSIGGGAGPKISVGITLDQARRTQIDRRRIKDRAIRIGNNAVIVLITLRFAGCAQPCGILDIVELRKIGSLKPGHGGGLTVRQDTGVGGIAYTFGDRLALAARIAGRHLRMGKMAAGGRSEASSKETRAIHC